MASQVVVSDGARVRLLVFLLRLGGTVTACAFLAMLLPRETMASVHEWLGLGAFPRAPVVEYLARSVAALYGFHGVLLLLVSRNPLGYRTIVRFIAVMNVVFGVMLIAIDLHAGLPPWWVAAEGPPIIAFGMVIAVLGSDLDFRKPR
jgi:hypothetical protein